VQALEQLRCVLVRRSYAGLVRVLMPATRSATEADLPSLVEGLERPEALEVQVTGARPLWRSRDHQVRLKREAGVWRIDDFD
jgi:hypothetical protein